MDDEREAELEDEYGDPYDDEDECDMRGLGCVNCTGEGYCGLNIENGGRVSRRTARRVGMVALIGGRQVRHQN